MALRRRPSPSPRSPVTDGIPRMGWLKNYEKYLETKQKIIALTEAEIDENAGDEEEAAWVDYALVADKMASESAEILISCVTALPEIARLKDIDGNTIIEDSVSLLAEMWLTRGKVIQQQVDALADQAAALEALKGVEKKWLAMVEQSDADNALINILHQEKFALEQKLAAVDEIAVSYFQYIEEGETADQAFYPSEEQCQVIKDAQHRLAEAALEVALDETEVTQLAPFDDDDEEDLTHLMPMTIHTDAQFKAWLDGDILTD